jgi:hypothetical protein
VFYQEEAVEKHWKDFSPLEKKTVVDEILTKYPPVTRAYKSETSDLVMHGQFPAFLCLNCILAS